MSLLRQTINQIEDLEIFDEEDFLQNVAAEIGKVKNNLWDIREYECALCPPNTFREIYLTYERLRKQEKKIDFDDMLTLTFDLFVRRPDVLKLWQQKFQYILVDEYQDINYVQYRVLRMLAAPQNNLFAVGDDDQSIYGFRGADAKLILAFEKDYPDAKRILLGINYRSTAHIVNRALAVIDHNKIRYQKAIHASQQEGECVHVQETADSNEEAVYVTSCIRQCLKDGIASEEIGVLYRTHTDARALIEQLIANKIGFQMKEHMPDIYEHFIAKDIMAYMRLANCALSRADLLIIMNKPKRYISRDALAGNERVDMETLRKFYFDKEWMQDRIDQLEWDLKMMKKMAPFAALNYLRKKVGYNEYLKEYAADKGIVYADLCQIADEIAEASKPFSTWKEWSDHIEEYRQTLQIKMKNREMNSDGVRLMTMHASKGLEFDSVFIIQANEGNTPYKKAKTDAEIEEERRLFYVAMTRAKRRLKVSYTKEKNGKAVQPSRFVTELLDE